MASNDKRQLATIVEYGELASRLTKGLKSEKDLTDASDLILKVRKMFTAIEAKRKERTAPANETIRLINEDYKKYLKPLKDLESSLKKAIEDYATLQVSKDLTQLAKLQKENKNAEIGLPIGFSNIPSDDGSVRFRKAYRITITDVNKIPDQYKKVDVGLIEAAIENAEGNISIPGVTFELSQTIALYAKDE